MDQFDPSEMRLQDMQHPAVYRAGCTLRTTFETDDQLGSDLTALMLQLARIPEAGDAPSGDCSRR